MKKDAQGRLFSYLAVSERFELSLGINLNTLSRRAPSATQPAHQFGRFKYAYT